MDCTRFSGFARAALAGALLATLALPAQAAGPVLRVERVDASKYPELRAYVSLLGSNGTAITGLAKENFKVLELKTNEVTPKKVQTLDQSGYGVAVVVVLQSSGTMTGVVDEIKKAASGFIGGLGDKDQVAVVAYSDRIETLAPVGEKGAAAGAVARIQTTGMEPLLFDGVKSALDMFPVPTVPVAAAKGAPAQPQAGTKMPAARAVVVLGDGRDQGSTASLEGLVSEAKKRRVPVFTIGHSQVGGNELETMRELALRTGGQYIEAPPPDNAFAASFGRILQTLVKQYVVEWKADEIESDGKRYDVEIAVEVGETKLRGSGEVLTPVIKNYTRLIVIAVVVLLLIAAGVAIWWFTRPKPPPVVLCPACQKEQMPDWDVCLFCLKSAKAKLEVTKGPNKGKLYPLVGKVVNIGKGPENAIKLMDPAVSTKHCGIQIDDTKFEVVDLGSSNGTFVNGKKVQRRFLRNGDLLNLGQSELKFESTMVDHELGDYSDNV